MALFTEYNYANNAYSLLASAISNSDTLLQVEPGEGALFPAAPFQLTLEDFANELREIVRVTDVTGDTFTVVRAQEGTAALAWAIGDVVSHRNTAGSITDMRDETHRASTYLLGDAAVGPVEDMFGDAPINGAMYYDTAEDTIGFRVAGDWLLLSEFARTSPASPSPPANPVANQFWFNSELLQLFIAYDDGDSIQFVPTSPVTPPFGVPITALYEVTGAAETLSGANPYTFHNFGARTVLGVRATVETAATTGTITIRVTVNGNNLLAIPVTIDATEVSSWTAASPALINNSFADLAEDDVVSIIIDDPGDVNAAGLKVYITTRLGS